MVDIILINAPIVLYTDGVDRMDNYIEGGDEFSFYPINLLYIAAMGIKLGYTVKVIDPTSQGLTLQDITMAVTHHRPRIIGITAMTPSIQSAIMIGEAVQGFGIPIVLGGIHVTNDPGIIQRFPYFDYGVVGEGEIEFYEIMQGKRKQGIVNANRIQDLDGLPYPARHLVDITKYKRPEQIKGESFFMDILSSRGCAYNCSFCSIPNSGHAVRFRGAKNVVNEMESIYDLCQGNFTFNDDCFTLAKPHVLAIANETIDRRLKISFMASTRANCIDVEVIKALKRIGCRNLCFGVESGSERIRNDVIGKRITDKDLYNAVGLCRKYGITASLFLMAGLPTEIKKDMQKTIHIGSKLKADYMGIHQTTPYPNSRIYRQAIAENKIPADIVDQWASGKRGRNFRTAWLFYIPDGFTQKDMVKYKRWAYIVFYFNPGWVMRKIWFWVRNPKRFINEDLKLFKLIPQVLKLGGTKGQFS